MLGARGVVEMKESSSKLKLASERGSKDVKSLQSFLLSN